MAIERSSLTAGQPPHMTGPANYAREAGTACFAPCGRRPP